MVPSWNNAKDFRYLYNLQSLMNLNYTNYKVAIVDDASDDFNYELIEMHLREHPNKHITLIKNEKKLYNLATYDKLHR